MTGPRYMLLSALSFAIMGALVKVAGAQGLPLLQIIFFRALVSACISMVEIRRAGVHPLGIHRGLLFARGAVGFIALVGVFYAFLTLPYAQATMLQYMHPVFTALLAYFFLTERPSLATLACILLSLLGLAWLVSPYWQSVNEATLPSLALIAGLGGALGSGIAYTLVRRLAGAEHPSVIVLYFPMVCIPGALLLGWQDFIWPSASGWLVLLGVGCFTQFGQINLTKAMQLDMASRVTSLSYLQIVFAAVLGWSLFGEIPTPSTLLGGALILMGALVTTLLQPRTTA